ncbi:MAG: Hydroxylamine oxidoreductase-linked cytochrome [Planctomycetota bacterium]|jgi:hypothetical protein
MKQVSILLTISFLGLVFLALTMWWAPPTGQGSAPADAAAGAVADKSGVSPSGGNEPSFVTAKFDVRPVTPATAPNRPTLQFPRWPKPAAVLVATGEQQGYFEPCGCTANQLGGMTRRAGLFRKLQDLNWDVRGVDVGSLSRRTGLQAQIKFETSLQALRELNYVAMGIGPEELRLDPGYLLSQHLTEGSEFLAFVSANLTFFGSRDVGTPLAKQIITPGGLRIGITSVLSETLKKEVFPANAPPADAEWTEPQQALTAVLEEFKAEQVQFRVLLAQATLEESREFARQFPEFNIIITAQGFGDGEQKTETIGSVQLIQAGEKGKTAGVIGIYPNDPAQPIRFELVKLTGDTFGDDPAMIKLMDDYQRRLTEQQVVAAEMPAGHPSGASFVGSQKCGECHTKALAVWEKTAHAHAFESLDPRFNRPGAERLHAISRINDPECLSCHVTGWDPQNYVRFRSGFLNQSFATTGEERNLEKLLAGNQCENCHGPGSQHVELIESSADKAVAGESVRVTLEQARSNTCVRCHDGDNSPEFDFDKYWEQVKHSDRD